MAGILRKMIYLVSGIFVAGSGLLALLVSIKFLHFTIFVGGILINFAFTSLCPMVIILRKLELKSFRK